MPNTIAQNLTRLVNAKEAIANAITTKGGTVGVNDGLESFSNSILNLPDNSGVTVEPLNVTANGMYTAETGKTYNPVTVEVLSPTHFMQTFSGFAGSKLPESLTIDLYNCTGTATYPLNNVSSSAASGTHLTLVFNDASIIKSLNTLIWAANGIKKLTISGNLSAVTTYEYFGYLNSMTTQLDFEFDFSSVINSKNANISISQYIEEMRYKPNTLSVSQNLDQALGLSDVSLVSIANGLNAAAEGNTLTVNSTKKTRCNEILGHISGGTFVIDASGTVTLTDFITNTKGWTLA